MTAFWSGCVGDFLRTPPKQIIGTLAQAQIRHFRLNEAQQLRAWDATITMLRRALMRLPEGSDWYVLLEYPMLRLGRRPDVILLAGHVIFVVEVKADKGSYTPADRRQVEDYAIDLHDFHAGCRRHPIIPILLAEHGTISPVSMPFLFDRGVSPPFDANAESLPGLLRELNDRCMRVAPRLWAEDWLAAPYHPVPTIVDAACMLYAKHNVAEIRSARSDAANLRATSDAILRQIEQARTADARVILFVTGIPGAGKTLCGLNTIFGAEDAGRGTYLTGNPTLVHALREALTRDAVEYGLKRGDAHRKMQSVIQALPKFRDHYVSHPSHAPAERIVVVDEAQRCWAADWAIAKTRDKPVRLTQSEPGHLLETMGRLDGFCAIVCLVGSGQEIHAGEGGLAEWGEALRRSATAGTDWRVCAPPDLQQSTDPRQRLGILCNMTTISDLHLTVPLRQVRSSAATRWVDHVLDGDATAAIATAQEVGDLPFLITRNAEEMRA